MHACQLGLATWVAPDVDDCGARFLQLKKLLIIGRNDDLEEC